MEKEKLNKAAIIAAANYDNPFDEPAYDKKFYDGFIASADWLMQQPLYERLTEDEKEKIKKLYKSEVNSMELENGRIKNAQSHIEQLCHESNFWQAKLKADMLESIFGADLFREK